MTFTERYIRSGFPYIVITASLCFMLATVYFGDARWSGTRSDYPVAGAHGSTFSASDYDTFYKPRITPDEAAIKELAARVKDVEGAYRIAIEWIYVSEKRLNGVADKWLSPREFLTRTPDYRNNPVPGQVVGDCEEQACTLVSLIRATGVPPENVRVVLGESGKGDSFKGHVWVEFLNDGEWLALDPSQGPYWDDTSERLIYRQNIPFDYYAVHEYPVTQASAYYNDVYYLELGSNSGNAPEWWWDIPREEFLIKKDDTKKADR